MNKSIITYIAVTTMALSPIVVFASQTPFETGNSASSATPATGDSSSTARPSEWSEVITTSSATPATGDSSSSATPTTGDSSSTAVAPVNSPVPVTNTSSGGSSSSSGSSWTSRVTANNCSLITSFMRYGGNNDSAQVTKLQSFLKNTEKIELDVNGTFDKKTEDAVIAFQNKYSSAIMGPWGATKGTGQVYITTLKQINKLACNQPLSLNSSELATIEAYKNARKDNNVGETVIITPNQTPATDVENNNVDKDTDSVGTLENSDQTASVAKTSIAGRFWKFIVGLFK